jgi:hypothetical protein
VLLATLALLKQTHTIARTNPPIREALSYVAVPGFTVGVVIAMLASRSTDNTSFWLAFWASIPVKWLLYYFVFLGILRLWQFILVR